ncbi:MAG: sugar ABC transporter ATP-binding protein, partial [Hyphomicrobiales bacterium]|nr:sugar ABC transporter ATP-binding protein [Hyphomicrobiales bacterium]
MNDSLVELRNVSKTFGGSRALDEVSLALRTAEIRCLAGENGCGKSTVIKIISGVYQPDDGEIWIDGHRVPHMTPIEAVRVGVEVIYQDFSLFGNLTVAENLSLNTFLRERRRLVDWGRQRRLAREALDRLGVDIDLDAEVARLPTA